MEKVDGTVTPPNMLTSAFLSKTRKGGKKNFKVLKVWVVLSFPSFFFLFVSLSPPPPLVSSPLVLRAGSLRSLHTSVLLNSLASHAALSVLCVVEDANM